MDNDPQNIKARADILAGCAKIEAERREPLVVEGYCVSIGEGEHRGFILDTFAHDRETAGRLSHYRNIPDENIVKVRIEEVME